MAKGSGARAAMSYLVKLLRDQAGHVSRSINERADLNI